MMNPSSRSGRDDLSDTEAAARLALEGPNELPGGGRRSMIGVVLEVLREPMLLLLLAAGLIYLLLGDMHDALILLVFAGLTILIAAVQEIRTEHAVEALRDLGMPQAIVIREGRRLTVASRELVRGDLLVVQEGGRVAADGWVIEADALQVDEAILTGESVAVSKAVLKDEDIGEPPLPGGDGVPYAYSGTLVVRGTGLVRIAATGPRSRIGAIGQSLGSLESETPRLLLQTRWLVRWFAAAGLGVSALAILLYGLLRGGWLEALLSGIAIAMSLLPEELPVVLTLFLTMGALRMSRSRVLARRGTAIETLGAATVLCTDKTGTLTHNRMRIVELRVPEGGSFRPGDDGVLIPQEFQRIASLGILASAEEPFDPMEKAFHELAEQHPAASLRSRQDDGWSLQRHYPLAPQLLAMSQVWSSGREEERLVAAKGAPEAIADLCGLDAAESEAMRTAVAEMATRGLRVLGVAQASWRDTPLPEDQTHFTFSFVGLVGLVDPVRETVPGAVADLQRAGIRVVMITGDYPVTASAIAAEAGITVGEVMSGEELARIGDAELARRIGAISVFARVMPEQKLRIVHALKEAGEIVAMTGDGVNDAPSLKAAHIGIAMGQRGTDVAREASSIVLLDDDFGSIVSAVRLGRRIYDNIRKATGFIFAVHLPIGGLAIAPLLTGWPLILDPVHIALLEMVIDPVCSLAFEAEPEEDDIMRRRPRVPDSPLVSRGLLTWSALQGTVAVLLLLGLAAWTDASGMGEDLFRATCFAGLIAAVLVLVLANRSFGTRLLAPHARHNLPLAVILGVMMVVYALLFFSAPAARLFNSVVLEGEALMDVAVMALVLVGLLFAMKSRFRSTLAR